MKIKQSHYNKLKEIMKHSFQISVKLRQDYVIYKSGDREYVWDLFSTYVPNKLCSDIYEYLNEYYIESVLLKILRKETL